MERSISDVCQRYIFEAQVFGEHSASIQKICDSIWNLILSEAEDLAAFFSPICQLMETISKNSVNISEDIKRSCEDLNDIVERNFVYQRKVNEHSEAMRAYENWKMRLDTLKKTSPGNRELLREPEQKTREAGMNAKQLTVELIDYKKRFDAFVLRRVKSAMYRISNSIAKNNVESIDLLNRFIEGINDIQKGEKLSNRVLYGQDTVPNFDVPEESNQNQKEQNGKQAQRQTHQSSLNQAPQAPPPSAEQPKQTSNNRGFMSRSKRKQNSDSDDNIDLDGGSVFI